MLHRRSLLSLTTGIAGTAAFGRARADAATDRAVAFVHQTGDALIGVINRPGDDAQKRMALAQIIDRTVDVPDVAQFCLGRFWRAATPQQRQRYMDAFHQVLVTNIASKLGEYEGVRFTVNRANPGQGGVQVDTTVLRPNQPPANVGWVIANPTTDPKIVDVIAEGTSLRLTQRSDYGSYLTHNNDNVDALISAMQHQVAQNARNGS
jgi:phospholipid transport system substrate-binding protein